MLLNSESPKCSIFMASDLRGILHAIKVCRLVSQPFLIMSTSILHSFFSILWPTLTRHKLVFVIQVCNYLLSFNIWKIMLWPLLMIKDAEIEPGSVSCVSYDESLCSWCSGNCSPSHAASPFFPNDSCVDPICGHIGCHFSFGCRDH